MASKSENSEIAVLQTQMGTVQVDVTEIKGDIKTILTNQEKNNSLEQRIEVLETRRTFQTYIVPIVCTVLASILTFLVINYFHDTRRAVQSTSITTTTQK